MSIDTAQEMPAGDPSYSLRASLPQAAPRLFAAGPGADFATHQRTFGSLNINPATLLEQLKESGLTGRGGAAFSAWRKLASASTGAVLVANAAEGEPLSFKDATLLHNAPHLVIDGLLSAATILKAKKTFIYTNAANIQVVQRALAQRPDARHIELLEAPDTFVAGQASAVINFMQSGKAVPLDATQRLTQHGFKGRPTVVNNVETWAQLALIARYGAAWFRELGTASDPGTRLLSVSGDVPSKQVLEVPGGIAIEDVLALAGVKHDAVSSVLIGGFHGRWIRPAGANLGLAAQHLTQPGENQREWVKPGAGVVHVIGAGRCGLDETAQMVKYLADQSARQCGPCEFGLPALSQAFAQIADGHGGQAVLDQAARLMNSVTGRGSCHHPDGTAGLVKSALTVFADDISWHARGRCIELGAHIGGAA